MASACQLQLQVFPSSSSSLRNSEFKITTTAVYEFAKSFLAAAKNKFAALDGNSDKLTKINVLANIVGGATSVVTTSGLGKVVKGAITAPAKWGDKLNQDRKKIVVTSNLNAASSQSTEEALHHLFLEQGIRVYNLYKTSLEFITFHSESISSVTRQTKLEAIQKLAEYAGGACFNYMVKYSTCVNLERALAKESLTKEAESALGAIGSHKVYYWVLKHGGEEKSKTLTPYAFFVEKFLESYDINTKEKRKSFKKILKKKKPKPVLIKTEFSGQSSFFSCGDLDEGNLLELIKWEIGRDKSFSWEGAIHEKVKDTQEGLVALTKTSKDILEEIQNNKAANSKAVSPIKNISFNVNKPMTTVFWRENFITDLHTEFTKDRDRDRDRDQHRRTAEIEAHIIVGTGGVGKTTVVRRYIQQHKITYNHIIWIDAQDPSTAENQFKLLATTKLDIKTDMENKPKDFPTLLDEIYDKLVQHQAKVLLIFDNAEATTQNQNQTITDADPLTPKGIRPLLPKSLPPHSIDPIVIITSRQRNWDASIFNIINLDLWSEDECSNFVLEKLGLSHTDKNRATAFALGNYFGCLPIAVQSAVSIIQQQLERQKHSGKVSYEIHHLISDYESAKQKMLTEADGCCNSSSSHSHFPEMSLWDVSLKKIVKLKNGTPPIQILCFMAYLFPNTIPMDFLRALFQQDPKLHKNKGPHSSTALVDPGLDDALVLLTDYSLITLFDTHYTIHRMIQDAIIHHLKETNRRNGKKSDSTAKIFNKKTFSNETQVLTKLSKQISIYLKELPIKKILAGQKADVIANSVHVTTHVSPYLQILEVRSFTQAVANILKETYSWDMAVDLYKKLLDTFLQDKKVDHGKVLEIQERIVDILEYQGNFEEALDLYSAMLPLQLKLLGPRHPSTIETQTNIVFTLQKLGRSEKAKVQFSQVQNALARILDASSENHSEADLLVTVKYDVACLHYEHSNYDEALILLKQILEKQTLKSGHLSTLRTTCMISDVISKHGKCDNDQDIRFKVPTTSTHLTFFGGSFHKSRLTYRTDYAWKLYLRGKLERALKIFEELLDDTDDPRRSKISDPSSDISFTKYCIAYLLHDLEEYDRSIKILEEILAIKERQFGPGHFLTLGTKEYIALTLRKQRKYSEAIKIYQHVLQTRLQMVANVEPSDFDRDILLTKLHLGWAYFHKGEYRSSKKISKDVLKNVFKNNQSLKIQFPWHYSETKELLEASSGRRSVTFRFCRCLQRSCKCSKENQSFDPLLKDKATKKTLDELYGQKEEENEGDVAPAPPLDADGEATHIYNNRNRDLSI